MIESVGLQDGDLRQAQPCFQAFGRPDEAWLLKGNTGQCGSEPARESVVSVNIHSS